MIKDIVTDEAILSQPCEPATAADAEVAQDLVDTLLANEEAAALAANQIGVTKAIVAYLNEKDRPVVMYNPQITQALKPRVLRRAAQRRAHAPQEEDGGLAGPARPAHDRPLQRRAGVA